MKKALILLLISTLALAGCGQSAQTGAGNKQDAPKEPAKTESAAKTESSADSKAPADKPKEQSKEKPAKEEAKVLKTGEKFTLKDWEVTLDSFEFNKSVKDKMFSSSASDGNKFLVLQLSVTNNGTAAESFVKMIGGTSIKAIYNDKYEYKVTITMIDGDLSKSSIQPLSTNKGFTVIEMPDKVADAPESLVVVFESGGAKSTVKLR
ncbi:hypothetical protein C8Z91_03245 [Paenibacillus elgii]|uniref:DUF4352 domain-containing protein n=1 Tax=Paenibacillus elgii TaxID=189691 RepID=A0A2T6G8L6_9BACL|nr:DUF4352 domain-containing protein [Paenibacillus elgii]PUA40490.1 hypothetical protein C8Z91_03245 [Paenibacillus elgii]